MQTDRYTYSNVNICEYFAGNALRQSLHILRKERRRERDGSAAEAVEGGVRKVGEIIVQDVQELH